MPALHLLNPMSPTTCNVSAGRFRGLRHFRVILSTLSFLCLPLLSFAQSGEIVFNIPAGEAPVTLQQFSEQSGVQLLYAADQVQGVRTVAVYGKFSPLDALNRLLAKSDLFAMRDEKTGALTINRKQSGRSEPATPQESATRTSGVSDEITQLSPFEVTGQKDLGYRKLSTVTSSRAGVEIINDPVAIEVISGELLKDFSLTDKAEAFKFSNSVTVSPNEVFAGPLIVLRGFDAPLFYNGAPLSNVFGLLPYLITDNIDRVEVAKGAAGLLYGNTTAGGVINFVSKKPQFTNATSLDLTYGSYNYYKALLDYQAVIRPGLAVRLLASHYGTDNYADNQKKDMTLIAPSVTFRPGNTFEVSLAASFTNQHIPYPNMAANFAVNPQYYEDYLHPSQSILDYMKSTYSLASDAEAHAKIVERWGENAIRRSYLDNWVTDTLGRTGVEPWRLSSADIEWWRFSPKGDKANFTGEGSNVDGKTMATELGVRFSPLPNLTVNYQWQHMTSKQGLWLDNIYPGNGGVRPDGRVWTLTAADSTSTSGFDGGLPAEADTQQLDALYTFDWGNIEHQFQAGAELRRATSAVRLLPLDFNKAAPRLDRNGTVLTGIDAFRYYDPFGSQPEPDLRLLVSGQQAEVATTLSKYRDFYASYRAKAMDDKLNLLLGGRRVHQIWPEPEGKDYTWTVGALYTVTPGFRVFASASKVIVFTNQLSVDNAGATAADNPHKLENESGEGIEFGIKTNWKNNTLSGSVSYYKDQRANIVSYDTVKSAADPRNNDDDPNNLVSWWTNGGLYQVQGIDGDLTWTPNSNFQAMFNWNYMWQANIVSDPSQNPANANTNAYKRVFDFRRLRSPEWKTNLVLKYNFTDGPLKNVSVGGAIAYTDAHHFTDSYFFPLEVPAETIFDVFFAYQTKIGTTPTTFRLNLINLTDERNDIYRGNGREIRLSAGFKY